MFQWAPTLGGECYAINVYGPTLSDLFQWAPTLGGECYWRRWRISPNIRFTGFNGHPPLGVNATGNRARWLYLDVYLFQWAPTLGGECYGQKPTNMSRPASSTVSMGTHPWG